MAALPQAQRAKILEALTDEEKSALEYDWSFWARPNQLPPEDQWFIWLIRSGRGGGKSRTAAEWVIDRARQGYKRIALIGQTKADVRDTMIEVEESSILKISASWFMPTYSPSNRRLTFPNGSVASAYSGDEPDQLRGPSFDTAWIDELCKFKYPKQTWDNLMFSLRAGSDPKVIVTSTPRPIPVLKEIMARSDCHDSVYSSYENFSNLSEVFINNLLKTYDQTRIGRQEIYGEILGDNPNALWKLSDIEDYRVTKAPDLRRIVVGVDPAVSSNKNSAETGIVVAGKSADGHYYILDDCSIKGSPDRWARAAISAYHKHKADRIIAEKNQGGDLVSHTLTTIEPNIPIKLVHASRGKQIRAEPISALSEQGKIHFVGVFSELEQQLCEWNPEEDRYSPDRLDGMVWAVSSLTGGSMYYGNVSLAVNNQLTRISPNRLE